MTELEKYISYYFASIDEAEINSFSKAFKKEIIKKNEYFLKTGKYSNKLSFVQSGILRVFVETEEKEITQWISTQGYFVTDLESFVFDSPARWNIQALTDVELFSISKENYNNLKNLIPRWPELEKLFLARCFVTMENRIFQHLSLSSEERYEQLFKTNPELFNLVPLQYLASMLGMTPETLSRIRKKMQKKSS